MEDTGQPQGKFEMVVACISPYRGLVHLSHERDLPIVAPELWSEADRIRSSAFRGPFHGAACIVSRYGNLEVVATQGDGSLAHFWRKGIYGWRGPTFLPSRVAGPPTFIQSRFGSFGNFEVIAPRPGGGLSHFWRNNDGPAAEWHEAPPPTTGGTWEGVSLLHDNVGNLQLIGVRDRRLVLMVQRGAGGPWRGPRRLHNALWRGRPSLIQTAWAQQLSFEMIAANSRAGLINYSCNSKTGYHWQPTSYFGKDRNGTRLQFDDVTSFQSSLGYLEIFARDVTNRSGTVCLRHYRRANSGPWEGPIDLPAIVCDP